MLLRLLSCSSRAERVSAAVAFAFVVVTLSLLLAIGTPVVMRFGHDCFIFLDGAYRLSLGQTLHVDVHSPLGAITPWLFSLGMRLVGPTARALLVGVALFAGVTSIWAWAIGRQRLAPALNALLVVLVLSVASGLYTLGFEFFETSFASIFNRFSFAILSIILIECLVAPPSTTSPRGLLVAGSSTGFAIVTLFFLKPSYIAPSLLLVVVGIGVVSRSKERGLGLALGVVLGFVAWRAVIRFHFMAMASDYFDGLDARKGFYGTGAHVSVFHQMIRRDGFSLTASKVLEIFRLEMLPNVMLMTAAVLVPAKTSALMPVYAARRTVVVCAALVILVAVPIVFSNWQWSEVPTTAAFAIALVEYGRRSYAEATDDAVAEQGWRLAALGWIATLLVAMHVGKSLLSLAFALQEKDAHTRQEEIDTPPTRGLTIVSSDGWCRPRVYPARIESGIKLLEPVLATRRPRVLVFDFSNPFSFALQLEPPRGGMMWWHFGATFNNATAPQPARLFAEVDVVMVPKCSEDVPTTEQLMQLYRGALTALYEKAGENNDWVMLTRRAASAP